MKFFGGILVLSIILVSLFQGKHIYIQLTFAYDFRSIYIFYFVNIYTYTLQGFKVVARNPLQAC